MGQDGKCSQAALVQLRSDVMGQLARLEALLPLAKSLHEISKNAMCRHCQPNGWPLKHH
jgi:hypothetical protein